MKNTPFQTGINVFLTIFLLVVSLGCKSTKTTVVATTKTDSIVRTNVAASVGSTANLEQLSVVRDQSQINEETTETITEIVWSEPDSTGKQFIIRKTTTVRSRNAKAAIDQVKEESSKSVKSQKSTQTDKSKSSTKKKNDVLTTIKTKISTPGFITWGVSAIVVAVLVFVFLFLKSKHII